MHIFDVSLSAGGAEYRDASRFAFLTGMYVFDNFPT
jgi:hypothetical protein